MLLSPFDQSRSRTAVAGCNENTLSITEVNEVVYKLQFEL